MTWTTVAGGSPIHPQVPITPAIGWEGLAVWSRPYTHHAHVTQDGMIFAIYKVHCIV